jgi:hypothetical protein
MTHRLCLFFTFLLLFACRGVLADEAAVPQFKNPPLKYINHKTIGGVVTDPNGTVAVVDELLIGDRSNEKLTFWFYLYGPNFHICSMAGNAVSIAVGTYQYREGNCQLRITATPDGMEIEDVGGYCKTSGNCGSRAYIGKTSFSKRRAQ